MTPIYLFKEIDHLNLLKDIVTKPMKYWHVVNVPGQYEAAEYLYNNHWDELTAKQAKAVEKILVRSGKYYYTNN